LAEADQLARNEAVAKIFEAQFDEINQKVVEAR
jgi:hypothetical protein